MVRGFFDKTMLVLSKGKSSIEYECHYSVQVKFFGTVNRLLTRSPVFFHNNNRSEVYFIPTILCYSSYPVLY